MGLQVTHSVACLARWMAADLYLREVDVLRFEVCGVLQWQMFAGCIPRVGS